MPISREAFELRMPGGGEAEGREIAASRAQMRAGRAAREFDQARRGSEFSPEEFQGVSKINAEENERPEDKTADAGGATKRNLPPADAASAGTEDGIGPTQPQTEARRSVATGRDAPDAPGDLAAGGSGEPDGGQTGARTEVIGRRLERQKGAVAEHLGRIEGIVEGLMELTEAHLFDGEQKLQALEQKLAQMEMRYSLNRTSP